MDQKTKSVYFSVIALTLVFGFASLVAVAKNDNSDAKTQSQEKSKGKTEKLKDFEKADNAKGTTNAQLHTKKIKEVAQNLEGVADTEEDSGNQAVSDEIEEVADEQQEIQDDTAEAIEEVEKAGKVKTFLLGTDYKNLGQLRSTLAHSANDIRKLTKSLSQVQTPESKLAIETELAALMGERERIKGVIYEQQDGFSLFGWLSRLMTGYVPLPVVDPAEDALVNEVETAIETADVIVPVVPATSVQ